MIVIVDHRILHSNADDSPIHPPPFIVYASLGKKKRHLPRMVVIWGRCLGFDGAHMRAELARFLTVNIEHDGIVTSSITCAVPISLQTTHLKSPIMSSWRSFFS